MLLVLLLSSALAAEPESCTPVVPMSRYKGGSLALTKAGNQTAVRDAAQFCDESVSSRLAEEKIENHAIPRHELEPPNTANRLLEYAMKDPNISPWSLSIIPHDGAKKAALQKTLETMPVGGSVESALDWLAHADERAPQAVEAWNAKAKTSFAALKSAPPAQAGMIERFGLCTMSGSPSPRECTKALGGIIEGMSVVADPTKGSGGPETKFSMVKEMEEIVTDPKYQAGLRAAAISVLKRTQSKPKAGAHLFGDVESAFRKSGLSEKDAADAAWKTIAVISTGGPAIMNRLAKINLNAAQIPGAVSLSAIASALPMLDAAGKKSGHLYSYPPNVKTNCDNGKPYHFWMSAYQARQQALSGIEPRVAAQASFLTALGYRLTDPEILRLMPKNNSYSPMMNVMRADFAYAAAGASFGAASASGKKVPSYSIDQALQKSIESSVPVEKLTEDTLPVNENLDRGTFQIVQDYRRLGKLVMPLSIYRDVSRSR